MNAVKAKVAMKLVSSLAVSAILLSVVAACDLGLTPFVAGADAGPTTIIDAGNTVTDAGTADAGGDAGDAGDAATGPKRVFVTSMKYQGNFGGQPGQAGADAICNTLGLARLGGRYVAWVSETVGKDAIDHLTDVGPWYLVDRKTLIFANKAAIPTGPLQKINLDETGAIVSSQDGVWTGTVASGRSGATVNTTCTDWTVSGLGVNGTGISGGVGATRAGEWTSEFSDSCFMSNRIYCFEQ